MFSELDMKIGLISGHEIKGLKKSQIIEVDTNYGRVSINA